MFQNIKGDINVYNQRRGVLNFIYLLIFNAGFSTIFWFRVYSYLYKKGLFFKIISKGLQRIHIIMSSCYFSPDSKISPGLKLPHPTGVVIGEGAVIKSNVTLYQGVTLGKGSDGMYPTIETGACCYPNSVLIGGICVSKNSIIGANSFVNKSIPESSIYAGVPAKFIAKKEVKEYEE